ncbi:hypothetical protein L6164_006032 [Bauhinia variegata]|uniref:Uncharacterized protein n=1 Tax=Bauhinia variegata TaxID=167791 RepID=A0ACB9PT45_BAUVA|nr:hypothetical protein L6164_006032 [Bauhinia variegata]
MSHFTSLNSEEWNSRLESVNVQKYPENIGRAQGLRNRASVNESEIYMTPSTTMDSSRNSNASKEGITDMSFLTGEVNSPSKMFEPREVQLVPSLEQEDDLSMKWKRILWKSCVTFILLLVDEHWRTSCDVFPFLEQVSYSLLVFFYGMFIMVDGFNKSGIPSAMWDFVETYSRVDHANGIAVLAMVILVLSNFASNVPTGMLISNTDIESPIDLLHIWTLTCHEACSLE